MASEHDREAAATQPQLPSLIRRYVERNVPPRDPLPQRVRFTQVGEMQLKPGRWTSFQARQEVWVERVEFVWRARFPFAPLVWVRVVDWYRAGEGGLTGRLLGVVPVVGGRGSEFAKSEALRYLAEIPWVPYAIIGNRELEWRQLDDATVEVATEVGSARAAVRLHFDAAGDITSSSAHARPRMQGKRTIETPWTGRFTDYQELGGVRVPTKAEVFWELPEGPFTYFRGQVIELDLEWHTRSKTRSAACEAAAVDLSTDQ